jgi:hypothetical protein
MFQGSGLGAIWEQTVACMAVAGGAQRGCKAVHSRVQGGMLGGIIGYP